MCRNACANLSKNQMLFNLSILSSAIKVLDHMGDGVHDVDFDIEIASGSEDFLACIRKAVHKFLSRKKRHDAETGFEFIRWLYVH